VPAGATAVPERIPLRSGGLSLMAHWGPAGGTWPEAAAAARSVSGSAWRSSSSFPGSTPRRRRCRSIRRMVRASTAPTWPVLRCPSPTKTSSSSSRARRRPGTRRGGGALQDADGTCLRAELALLTRAPCVEPLHRLFEDPRERAEQGAVSSESRALGEGKREHPLAQAAVARAGRSP
jgi:hypothetical protein